MLNCTRCNIPQEDTEFAFCKTRYAKRGNRRHWCASCTYRYQTDRLTEAKLMVFDKLGHSCKRCGFVDKRALQIDHVNGGGNKEHMANRNNSKFLKKVFADTSGAYQILCANCNWIKRAERNETAHRLRYTLETAENAGSGGRGAGAVRLRI